MVVVPLTYNKYTDVALSPSPQGLQGRDSQITQAAFFQINGSHLLTSNCHTNCIFSVCHMKQTGKLFKTYT